MTPKNSMSAKQTQHTPGDVFQIIETHGRKGWIGAFVMATEIRSWGIQGFVAHVVEHEEQARACIRLRWDEIEFVGRAPLMPEDIDQSAASDQSTQEEAG